MIEFFEKDALNKIKSLINAYRNGTITIVAEESEMDIIAHKYTLAYIIEQVDSIIRYYETLNDLSKKG